MAVTLDASTPAAVYQDANNTTSCVTASFTPPSGSIVVAKTYCADGSTTSATPTGLTFTQWATVGTTNTSTRVVIYTATGGGSSVTVTATFAGSVSYHGLVVEVWTGAQLAATPATHVLLAAGSAPSDSITTVAANSVVSWACGDWTGVDGTSTRAYRSSASESNFHWATGAYTVYSAYQVAASTGAQTYGLTAPTGQSPSVASIEIQSSGGPAIPPIIVLAPRRP